MRPPKPLTERERESIFEGRAQGKTIREIADELHCSPNTVGKWWRRIRDEGPQGLRTRRRGPKCKGALSRFPSEVAHMVLELKRRRPRQGADHILTTLRQMERFREARLPTRSRVAAYFKERWPELLHTVPVHPKRTASSAPPKATAPHEIWQLDSQENIELADGTVATVCNVRDPFGAAMIASQAFSTKTDKRWRKLTWTEIRDVLRTGFSEWRTLPNCVQTDNELILVGNPSDPLPSLLTLWLVGLGIQHHAIRPHCPTDQAEVERTHRTLADAIFGIDSLKNLASFQAALDQERVLYNDGFPSRASDCQGQSPIEAHPVLKQPRRPYQPQHELILFDLQRVYEYLATFTLERRTSASGTIGLEARQCSIGRRYAGQAVMVRCDPTAHEWIVFQKIQEGDEVVEKELVRRPILCADVELLTGLRLTPSPSPATVSAMDSVQLTLPCLI